MPLVFEWDSRKAKSNQRKHKVSFDEACTVFDDVGATIFPDADHSNGEEREIIVGYSMLDRILLVSFYGTVDGPRSNNQRSKGNATRTEGL